MVQNWPFVGLLCIFTEHFTSPSGSEKVSFVGNVRNAMVANNTCFVLNVSSVTIITQHVSCFCACVVKSDSIAFRLFQTISYEYALEEQTCEQVWYNTNAQALLKFNGN